MACLFFLFVFFLVFLFLVMVPLAFSYAVSEREGNPSCQFNDSK